MQDCPRTAEPTEEFGDSALPNDSAVPTDSLVIDDYRIRSVVNVDRAQVPLPQQLVDKGVPGHPLSKVAHQPRVGLNASC